MSYKVLQSMTDCSGSNLSGWMQVLIPQAIDYTILHDKRFGHVIDVRLFLCAQLLRTDCEYHASLQTSMRYVREAPRTGLEPFVLPFPFG